MILVLLGSTYTRSVVPNWGARPLGGARSYDKGGTARQCTYSQPIFIGMHRNFKEKNGPMSRKYLLRRPVAVFSVHSLSLSL